MKFLGIPLPPSINNAYPTGKDGRRFKSKKYREWESLFARWASANFKLIVEARLQFNEFKPNHFIRIDCGFYFPRKQIITFDGRAKRNDTSNRIKILHDAIAKALLIGDEIFFDGTFCKRPVELNQEGYCNVFLRWCYAEWMSKPQSFDAGRGEADARI